MIYELKKNEFNKVLPVVKKLAHRACLMCVIERNNPGRIFVDDTRKPKTVLVWTKWGFNFLVGDENNDKFNQAMHKLIMDKLIPEGIKLGKETGFVLYSFPETFGEKIEFLFADKLPLKDYRNTFTYNPKKFKKHHDWKAKIPSNFYIKRIDEKLAEKFSDDIKWNWDSISDFLSKGFGFCLLKGEEIVSTCYSMFVGGAIYEIEMDTNPRYREQGFATLTASVFIEHCLLNDLTPCWECWQGHKASNALAEKLGFKFKKRYLAYSIEYTEFDTYIDHGVYYFRDEKQFRKSAEHFEKAFKIKEGKDWHYYWAACAWVIVGDSDAAIRNLNKAIDKGWKDIEYMKKDENLKSLHGTKGWKMMIHKYRIDTDPGAE